MGRTRPSVTSLRLPMSTSSSWKRRIATDRAACLDRSRSGTRRWCSSGDCGNRDRVRRHYSRTRLTR
ncbi:CGNR zinc finger domain-containing protein [Streptomyces sp. NPDC102274]|uniref:CGNR zinc finger domain-containing protein n=1 Tax=Streptomyces sp. NPDC102274 TaxID=3366151 RepID=UPI00380C1CB2